MAKVTLQDVADAVGVSRMTVSNAFNRPHKLSASLRATILETADALGYGGKRAHHRCDVLQAVRRRLPDFLAAQHRLIFQKQRRRAKRCHHTSINEPQEQVARPVPAAEGSHDHVGVQNQSHGKQYGDIP